MRLYLSIIAAVLFLSSCQDCPDVTPPCDCTAMSNEIAQLTATVNTQRDSLERKIAVQVYDAQSQDEYQAFAMIRVPNNVGLQNMPAPTSSNNGTTVTYTYDLNEAAGVSGDHHEWVYLPIDKSAIPGVTHLKMVFEYDEGGSTKRIRRKYALTGARIKIIGGNE